jgi:hypothetical protein
MMLASLNALAEQVKEYGVFLTGWRAGRSWARSASPVLAAPLHVAGNLPRS